MTDKVKDSKRMELICEYIKSGKQPNGFKIIGTKNGKYRLSKIKTEKESLEERRKKLQKSIENIDAELKKLEESKQEEKPVEEAQ